MIFAEPALSQEDNAVLQLIDEQRVRLGSITQHNPRRWMGSLRRRMFARAIQGSNSIEGYNATMDEAIGVVEDEPPLDERTEAWYALSGYRVALTYILQAATDPDFEFNKQMLKSLQFMMLGYDLTKNPGQWRPGPIGVVSSKNNERVYEAPERELVDGLVTELCSYIKEPCKQHILVKAAMVHLNLTLIHPFSDGNGRMSRAMQTLMLASDGLIHPVFSSIEEWLGNYTDDYYQILADVGHGTWSPSRSAHPWIKFCLKAHFQQASTVLRRMDESALLFTEIEQLVTARKLHDRMTMPLFDSALGMTLTNARYQEDADVTSYIASRDLRALADAGLLETKGETRARRYPPSPELRALREKVRIKRALRDPYVVVQERGQVQPMLL